MAMNIISRLQGLHRKLPARFSDRLFIGGLAFIMLAVLGVVELSDDVIEGETQEIDEKIISLLRVNGDPALPVGPDWLRLAITELTALGGHTILILFSLMAAGFCLVVRRYGAFFFLLLSAAGAILLNSLLKAAIGRERPSVVEPLVEVSTFSYPSGHALLSSALYLSFAFLIAELAGNWRARGYIIAAGFLFAGLIGLSRIYLGVHYPSDIIAGWAIGTAWAMTCWLFLRRL
jgi:undecaprenyl-diphosphatase